MKEENSPEMLLRQQMNLLAEASKKAQGEELKELSFAMVEIYRVMKSREENYIPLSRNCN